MSAAKVDPKTCEQCGRPLKPGDWPWCPHGKGKYSFVMAVKIPGKLNGK